jgi:hypothetical protein|tara:strand:- start:199 stop:390 length:192 start_codon:yes stop_codon:yes gene_type:complete
VTLRGGTRFRQTKLSGHRQLTDIHLLGLARAQSGRLTTFDRRIPLKAVVGATARALTAIAPAN